MDMNVLFFGTDMQIQGVDSKNKTDFSGTGALFSQILLNSMVEEGVSTVGNCTQELTTELIELLTYVSSMSLDDTNELQKLIHLMLENTTNEKVSILVDEMENLLDTEVIGSLQEALMLLQTVLTAAQKSACKEESSLHLNYQLGNQKSFSRASDLTTYVTTILNSLDNKDALAKGFLQGLMKDTDKTQELVTLLKNIISKSEQKDFYGELSNKLSTERMPQIPLHMQQYLTSSKKLDTAIDVGKNVNSEDVLKGMVSTFAETSNTNLYEDGNSKEESGLFSHSNQPQNTISELPFRDQMMVANNQNISQDSIRDIASEEVKITYTTANDLQKQIQELVVSHAKHVKKPNGQQSITVTLHPASLGSLKIIVTSHQGHLTTSIMTDTIMTKKLIEGTINDLRIGLNNTGIQLDRIEIHQQNNQTQSASQTANAQSQLQQQKGNQGNQDEQQNKKDKNSGNFSFEELEELALDFINENQIDRRFLRNEGYSAAVNYTA